jgi:hypothetical protein
MGVDAAQHRAFQARVQRIEKRGPVLQIAPIGPAEDQKPSRKLRRQRIKETKPVSLRKRGNPLIFLVAFLFGCLAVALARYGRAAFLDNELIGAGLIGSQPGLAMLADFAAALVFAIVLKAVLGTRNPQFMSAQVIGAGVMVLAMHNLVHLDPDLWSLAFPKAWVNEVVVTTQPHSILIKGISFQL